MLFRSGVAVLTRDERRLSGYAWLRPCVQGYKIGPVFADDALTARALIRDLLDAVPGAPVSLDVPEPNGAALEVTAELGWSQPFACAKMIFGPAPRAMTARVFGVTSFEFG